MIRLVAFDAYGTLLDFTSATARCAAELGDKVGTVSDLWRRKQLEYTWLRSLMGRHASFRQVTLEALEFTLDATGLQAPDLKSRLMALYDRLDPFPEAAAAVQAVRDLGISTAILSNGDPDMLSAGLESAGLDGLLDGVLSVQVAGLYKPHPDVYRLACDHFGVEPAEVAFVSSNGWDVGGAAAFGFRVAWVNRAGAPPERLPARPEIELKDLGGLAGWLGSL